MQPEGQQPPQGPQPPQEGQEPGQPGEPAPGEEQPEGEFPGEEGEPELDEFGNPIEQAPEAIPMTTKPRQEPAGSRPAEMDPMETAMMANPMLQMLDPIMGEDPMMSGMGGPGGPPVEAGAPEGSEGIEGAAEPSNPTKQSAKKPIPGGADLLDDANGEDNVKTDQREHGGANLNHQPPSKVSTILRMIAYIQEANSSMSDEAAYDLALHALADYSPLNYGMRPPAADGPLMGAVKDKINEVNPLNKQIGPGMLGPAKDQADKAKGAGDPAGLKGMDPFAGMGEMGAAADVIPLVAL